MLIPRISRDTKDESLSLTFNMEKHFRIYEKRGEYHIQYRNYFGRIPVGLWTTLTTFLVSSPLSLEAAKEFFGTQVELYERVRAKKTGKLHAYYGDESLSGYRN